jgi:hypothetical protein
VDLTKPNQNITIKVGATNFQLQRAIEAALPAAMAQTKDLAKNFKGSTTKETCSKIYNFLMSNITYKVDGDNQKIKLPSAFLREKSGDCKSYSLFTGAILGNLKIPFNFTYASYNPKDKTPEHIYVTTKSGCIIDAVYGKFNAEKKPCYKYQKSMNISYISGIKSMRSEKNSKRVNNYNRIGNIFESNKNQSVAGTRFAGLGRTGLDWGNAVGRNFSLGEKTEYLAKNVAMEPARMILLMFIRNNGGGIASFLYSMWLRETAYELPNKKKYDAEFAAGYAAIDAKYKFKTWVNPADAVKRYQDAYAAFMSKNPNGTFTQKISDFYTPSQLAQYNLSKLSNDQIKALKDPEIKALRDALDKKYPYSTQYLPVATTASKERYRGIEWKWFWSLGGSPDDLNEAVKEGNTKSPRGKDANYVLNKAYNGGLTIKDLPLVIRGFVSAFAGDRFGLGQEGTYLLAINGVDPVDAATNALPAGDAIMVAKITAYSAACIPVFNFIMDQIRKGKSDSTDPSNNPNPNPPPADDDLLSGNTTMILLAAAGVGAYLYLKK